MIALESELKNKKSFSCPTLNSHNVDHMDEDLKFKDRWGSKIYDDIVNYFYEYLMTIGKVTMIYMLLELLKILFENFL